LPVVPAAVSVPVKVLEAVTKSEYYGLTLFPLPINVLQAFIDKHFQSSSSTATDD